MIFLFEKNIRSTDLNAKMLFACGKQIAVLHLFFFRKCLLIENNYAKNDKKLLTNDNFCI